MSDKKYIVAITGASGSIYGVRLIKALAQSPCQIITIISNGGFRVLDHELKSFHQYDFKTYLKKKGIILHPKTRLDILSEKDYAASPASGSFVHDGMAIAPCSMKTPFIYCIGNCRQSHHQICRCMLKGKKAVDSFAKGNTS